MSEWNAMTYEGKDTILRVVREEADGFFALAASPEAWTAQSACTDWTTRDIVGHIVDTTEGYFAAFDAARGGGEAPPPHGLGIMHERANEMAQAFRGVSQEELLERLRTDYSKMNEMLEALGPDDWTGLIVSHAYMGPVPAFFYAAGQLMDYGVHSWDIREGAGRTHGLSGEVADLLVPFMFVVWQSTFAPAPGTTPSELGIRVTSGPNAGDTRMRVGPEGLSYEQGDVSDLSTVIEFDPASFVLTAYGRYNAGTVRGDADTAERYLSSFFRI
jgi:uncharacterized protein (TIGR03083 family)